VEIKIDKPTVIKAAGNKPKEIKEYIGIVNSNTDEISIARMKSPAGWIEPIRRSALEFRRGQVHEADEALVGRGKWQPFSSHDASFRSVGWL